MDLLRAFNGMKYIIVYILVYTINTIYAEDEVSALAIVEGSAFPAPIAVTSQTFVDLITHGNIFIDKTQMIREIFQTESPLIVFARPSGWGKSINLNMVKVFSEIQVDCETQEIIPNHQTSGYRLFEHGEITMNNGTTKKLQGLLLISKNRLIMLQHQGQYIVVHINFGGLKAKNLTDLKKRMAGRARLAFDAYNYDRIAISLGADTRLMDEMARGIRAEKSNWTSFSEICGLLNKFYKREMILLVEDYDDPFIELFGDSIANPQSRVKHFLDFYDLFFDTIMEIKFLKKVIVTGRTLLLVHKRMFGCAADDLFGKPLHLHHGFNDREMDMIFDHLNIPPTLRKQATEHYSGYQLNMQEVNVYNPLSVVKFLASNKIENYWTPKRSMKVVFSKILQIPIFRYGLRSFHVFSLEKEKSPYVTNLILNKQYLLKSKIEVLVRFLENPLEVINRENGSNIFLYYYKNAALESGQYLLRSFGYLTRCYDIPNKEVETTIINELISFYSSSLKFKGKDQPSNSSLHVLCEKLKKFLLNDETQSAELAEAFSNFLNDLEGFNSSVCSSNVDQRSRDVRKIYVVSDVWNFIALYLKDFSVVECVTALRAHFAEGYMVFRHGNRGIIIQMVGRDLSDEETRFLTNELVKFLLPFNATEVEKGDVKQIVIHYQLDGNLTIAAKVTPSAVFSQMFKSASKENSE